MRVAGSRGCKANMRMQTKQIQFDINIEGREIKGNWAERESDLRRHLSAAYQIWWGPNDSSLPTRALQFTSVASNHCNHCPEN